MFWGFMVLYHLLVRDVGLFHYSEGVTRSWGVAVFGQPSMGRRYVLLARSVYSQIVLIPSPVVCCPSSAVMCRTGA